MLNPFSRKTPTLTESQKIIAAARKAAVNESCCAVDNEINGQPDHARLNRAHVRRLDNLANLLEARRNGYELTPAERVAVRLALDTLRQKLGKK
jgi:hypothetical protein